MTGKSAAPKQRAAKKAGGKKRAPSAYNMFMKKEMAALKGKYPNLAQKELFSKAVEAWRVHKGVSGSPKKSPGKGKKMVMSAPEVVETAPAMDVVDSTLLTQSSPRRKSPGKRSPGKKSPRASPKKSPKKSPKRSPRASPRKSPRA